MRVRTTRRSDTSRVRTINLAPLEPVEQPCDVGVVLDQLRRDVAASRPFRPRTPQNPQHVGLRRRQVRRPQQLDTLALELGYELLDGDVRFELPLRPGGPAAPLGLPRRRDGRRARRAPRGRLRTVTAAAAGWHSWMIFV